MTRCKTCAFYFDNSDTETFSSGLYYAGPTFLTAAAIFRADNTHEFHKFTGFTIHKLFANSLDIITTRSVLIPVAVVIIGREKDLPAILKGAFYELLCTPPHDSESEEDKIPSINGDRPGAAFGRRSASTRFGP